MSRARSLCMSVAGALAAAMLVASPAHAAVVTLRGVVGFGPSTPVAGISVSIWGSTSSAVTAADGSYSLAVPTGSVTLELSGRYLGTEFQASTDVFTVDGDRTESFNLPLPTRLAATVNESDGTPALGALVHLPDLGATGVSSSGVGINYSLSQQYCQVPDNGWCDIYFFAGYLPFLEITGPGRPTERFSGETFPVGTVNRTYTLAPSLRLGGSLRRADGQPAAGADVAWDDGSPSYARTGSDGTWSLRAEWRRPGRLHITGDDLDGSHQEPYEFESDSFDLTEDRTEDITLPALAHLEATVHDSVGNAVVDARVTPVGTASSLPRAPINGVGGTFYLRRSGTAAETCATQPGSGACDLSVFRGGVTAQLAVTPPGGAQQLFPVGATPEDINRSTLRLRGYALATSAGSSTGPMLVTTSATSADFDSLATSAADLPDGLASLVGRIDYRVDVPTGGSTSLRVVMPETATPNALLHVGPGGELADVTAAGALDGHQFDLVVTDGGTGDDDGVVNGVISGNVLPVTRDRLVVETAALPPAASGQPYEARLTGSGPVAPYSWRALDPLPPGLSLSVDGLISGAPTALGTWTFDVKMSESTGSRFVAVRTLSLTVATVVVATSELPDAHLGGSYAAKLERAGGGSFATWHVVSGSLPPGLAFTSAGSLTGRPTSLGTYRFGVTVTSGGKTSPSRELTLVVRPMEVATAALPNAPVGTAYSQKLVTSGGSGTLTWSVASGALPPGLVLSSAGTISGRPTAAGAYTAGFQVTDQSVPKQIATRTLTIVVSPMEIATASLPPGTKGSWYTSQLVASGGKPTLVWSLADGALPTGLKLSSAGRITGYPRASGTWTFTLKLVDGSTPRNEATRTLSLTVA